MNIAAYCRVSTDKADQLNSLEAQKQFFSEYTQRTGDNLVRLYADEGISGTKIKNRKEFLRMMADAEHGLFDMVVVKDISRFARNTVDLLQNVRKLKALGIETQFLTANMTSMGNSEFVLTIFGALAQEESANTSKRVKFGKKMNAEKGRVPNIVYGYDKTIGDYFNLAINEEEAAVIRQIYKWYIEEGYGAAKIANMLNAKGIRTKRNCQWSQNATCRILTNELYTGKIINGKQEVADFLTGQRTEKDETEWMVTERPELRIIEPEMYEKAQEILECRSKTFKLTKERQSNKYLFSTLIKCKECGWSFRRTVRTYKNTYIRWVCSGHNGRGADSCPNAQTVDEEELIEVIEQYNQDPLFHGILVQLPLPNHINEMRILLAIDPKKDVDGFHPMNTGNLWNGRRQMVPCTPAGIMEILREYNVELEGKTAVIIGRSNIVGKPMAQLLLEKNATVTLTHSRTPHLAKVCSKADVLIVAIGRAKFVTEDYVKEGAVVIDVGINRDEEGKLCGDVDFDQVKDKVGMITPVPGGVGPMTITMLMEQTYQAALRSAKG